jgi:hypothetical protein
MFIIVSSYSRLVTFIRPFPSREGLIYKSVSYFSGISCENVPLTLDLLSDRVQQKLNENINLSDIPTISPHEVWKIQQGRHKTQNAVPGELPTRLRYEFDVELSEPAAKIFNNITRTGIWVWDSVQEWGTHIKKCDNPDNETFLRIIAITNYFSLTYERFVLVWLLKFVGDKMDRDQFGGVKGHSVAHYLIEVQNLILYNQDLEKPLATLFAAVDVSQGFNRINHNKCITRLSDMGCPGWLLRIVASYLTERELTVRWKGKVSDKKPLPSGTGQGTILGLFLFCVMFDRAGPAELTEKVGQIMTQPRKKRKPIETGKKKWVDDLSLMVPIRLSDCLKVDTRPDTVRPVPYHSRTGHILPHQNNPMQTELNTLSNYFTDNSMITNQQKSKVMFFNRSKKYDVMP